VPGALAGLGVAWVLNRAMAPMLGHPIAFAIHTPMLIGCFVTALAIVLIAAWFPARRAARLKLAEAIQYQ
jgi:ABC-type lipoprotein release transport system permease subunit